MSAGRVAGFVIGAVLGIMALGLLAAGMVLTIAYAVATDEDGYFDATLERMSTATPAITTEEVDLRADPGPPDWLRELVDFSVRIEAIGAGESAEIFVGIGPEADVTAFLDGVARDEIRDVRQGGDVRYRSIPGTNVAESPADQTFWVAATSGSGLQQLIWEVEEGNWVAVLMNADGSPGVIADVTVGARSPAVLPIGVTMLALGVLLLIVAVVIIVLAAVSRPGERVEAEEAAVPLEAEPVRVEATIDSPLSQWLWLVKWFLAIPHYFVLLFLWIGVAVVTFIAFFAILFTARYPRGMFDFTVGVMRWTWRVAYYAGAGGLATDRYPPFTLGDDPDYATRFDVVYPERLSRGLVLVKWWLLAIPHYLVLAIIGGGAWSTGWYWGDGWRTAGPVWAGGLIGLLVFFAVVGLLFTGRYPRPLFDFIIGLNRWVLRVGAYVMLLTDRYPPFRLDQGGREPAVEAAIARD